MLPASRKRKKFLKIDEIYHLGTGDSGNGSLDQQNGVWAAVAYVPREEVLKDVDNLFQTVIPIVLVIVLVL